MRIRIALWFVFIVFNVSAHCQQQTDSLSKSETPNTGLLKVLFKGRPGKALAYSLILPGAGQVYNKSIWKVPIIYAGLGALGYSIYFNSKEYKRFDKALHERVDHPDNPQDEFVGILSTSGIDSYRKYYDKNLQLSYIGIGLVYLLNGIEAYVDRHLKDFDLSKDLSFKLQSMEGSASAGLSLTLHF